jgi:hypothetical protein
MITVFKKIKIKSCRGAFVCTPLYIYADFSFTRRFLLHAKAVYVRQRASSDVHFYKTDNKVFRMVIFLSPIFLRDELTDVARCSEKSSRIFSNTRCLGGVTARSNFALNKLDD